jgi:hypothetical protein
MHRKIIATAWVLVLGQATNAAALEVEAKVKVGKTPNACDDEGDCVAVDVARYAPFDLRVGRWNLEGTSRTFSPTQFTVGVNPDMTIHARGATSRSRIQANAGGGNSGFEGNLGGIWTFGGRLSFGQGEHGGLFGRGGIDAYLGGNSDFYHSHLELPRFELGYQLLKTGSLFIEAAGRGGLVLTGRHRVFDRTRDIGVSMSAGGYLTVQLDYFRVQLDAARIFEGAHAPKTPIDRGQADVCGLLGHLAVCISASSDRGEISSDGEDVATHADFIGLRIAGTDASITRYRF